jgi:acyl carrier protein
MTTFERVRLVIADELGIGESDISPNSSFVELGADSMDQAALILAIEEEFNCEIPQDEAQNLVTVIELVTYVDSQSCRV